MLSRSEVGVKGASHREHSRTPVRGELRVFLEQKQNPSGQSPMGRGTRLGKQVDDDLGIQG